MNKFNLLRCGALYDCKYNALRNVAILAKEMIGENKMNAWQLHSYGEDLQLTPARIPMIVKPNEVLVKVEAASINPIDAYMKGGYGKNLIGLLRNEELEFPLTLGRDFSGVLIDKGHGVGCDFKIGDSVYGIVPVHRQGSHAESVVVDASNICHRPKDLSAIESCSLLYAAMTAWSALYLSGGLCIGSPKNTKVLIIGASGGVGTVAVQMLKSQGATVIGTCSTNAIELVKSLGADQIYDYTASDYICNVASEGKYDIILDCAKFGHGNIPEAWQYSSFITLNSPLLENTDKFGLFSGLMHSAQDLLMPNIANFSKGRSVRWAFFTDSNTGLVFVDKLIKKGEIVPTVQKVFNFSEMPDAFEALNAGHLRGKIVVDYKELL